MKIIIYQNRDVYKEDSKIGNDSENKIETLEFEFPKEYADFTKYIEFQIKGEKYTDIIENNSYAITRAIAKQGKIKTQIVLRKNVNNDVLVFKSNVFELNVSKSINATETIPDQYPTWIDNLETLKTNLEKAERERVTAEQGRIEAETQREEIFIEMQEDILNAIKTIQDKKAEYDKNALDKTKTFNDNVIEKTNSFNTNVENQTKTYNDNAKNKLDEYNNNDLDKTEAYNDNTVVKINEFNEHVQDKKAEYDKHVENYNKRLDSVESKNTEQDKEIEILKTECQVLKEENIALKNQIPTGQAEGETIHLKDSSDMEMNWKIKSGHRQEKREGYNLFKNTYSNITQNGVTLKVNNDGTITLNGTDTSVNAYNDFNLIEMFEYTGTKIASVSVISGSATKLTEWQLTDKNWENTLFMGITNNVNPRSLKFKEGITYTNSTLRIEKGCVCNNLTIGLQIENGIEARPYEQYGTTPSPEYPSEIETVGSNVNLYNEETMIELIDSYREYNGKGIISNLTGFKGLKIPVRPKETYILSTNSSLCNNLCFFDKDMNFIAGKTDNVSFTAPDNCFYSTYAIKNDYTWIKFEKGSKATPWSPYGMGSVEIDVVNDNLFGKPLLNYAISGNSSDGFLVENNSNGVTYIAKLKNNLNYYIKKNNNVGNRFRIVLFSDYPVSTNHSKNVKELTTNVDLTEYGFNSDKYNYVAFTVNVNSELNEDCLVKLEQNTKATPYIEHQSQKQIIPIQQEMLEGDYIADVEHHEWGKKIFDGTETVVGYNTGNINKTAAFQINLSDSLNTTYNQKQMLTNMFNFNSTWGSDNECYNNSDKNFIVRLNVERLTGGATVNGFKAWLKSKYDAGNPVIVYYKLAEPVDLELTEEQKAIREQKLCTYKNITNISVDNELAKADVKYHKDLETIENNQQKQIDEIKELLSATTTSATLLDNIQKDLEREV